MDSPNRLAASAALTLAFLLLSGCFVHSREVVHDDGYAQGYKEGYYDRDHHRYWHDQAWHDCVENDIHCTDVR